MPKAAKRKPKKPAGPTSAALLPPDQIDQAIYVIRGQRVMLDADLAAFYGVSTKRLNEQVKRNTSRFPADFVFQLNQTESEHLRSHFATSKPVRGGRRTFPYAFTEHGALMAASVLNSEIAVQVSVLVVRAFMRLRQILATHTDLARRLEALEREFAHKTDEHEQHIRQIYELLDELMNPPTPPHRRPIGFAELMKPHSCRAGRRPASQQRGRPRACG